jgi:LacI family transcriptional regulator
MTQGSRRSKSAVTLRMVAAHAGVSPMSVSNVLNGRPASARTREAVERAVETLGYVPNAAARQLASAAPMFIGLVHANDEHPLSSALLTGALTGASKLGVQLLLQPIVFGEIGKGWEAVDILRRRGAEGVLVPPVFGEAMAAEMDRNHDDLPMICVNAADDLARMSTIRIDDAGAARAVTEMLIAKGHRRIGFLRAPPEFAVHHTRGAGYMTALRDHGLPIDPELIAEGLFTFHAGLTAATQLLDLADPPTAIFGTNDEMAAGALTLAHMRGLTVPDDLAIVGFEDSFFAQRLWPPLTSVSIPMAAMAETAIDQLVRWIRNGDEARTVTTTLADYGIVRRASTGD